MDIFGNQWAGHFDKISKDWQEKVLPEDVVLIGGDISWGMNMEDTKEDFDNIHRLNGTKVILRGNHDYWWTSYKKLRDNLPTSIIPIQNNCIRVGKYLFCGSRGWVSGAGCTPDDEIIYNREILRLEMSLKAMGAMRNEEDTVIGMTHFPPFGVNLQPSKITDLFTAYNVGKVIYGHLHGKDCYAKKEVYINRVRYYLTSCDLVDFKLVKISD